jgi:hypothetical protein
MTAVPVYLASMSIMGHLVAAAPAASCKTDADCSLNGICHAGGCVCDVAWTGAQCEQLSLLPPASMTPAYPPASWKGNTTSWGGSVVKSKTGQYHSKWCAFVSTSSHSSVPVTY